jgi:ubiquinone/menaquinone biosynthesis C-methylase UbiE
LGSASCYNKPLFASLWVRAWGEQYPGEVQPFSSCTRRLLQQLLEEVALPPGARFADLGCGSGGITLWVARESRTRGVGVDSKQAAIDIAKERISEWGLDGRVEFRCADFVDTGLAAHSVDAVISVDAFPPGSEIQATLQECRRILRHNGRLVFTARQPAMQTERWDRLGPEWRVILERTGFEVARAAERLDVSRLWLSVFHEWTAHEASLRAELPNVAVDGLLHEARAAGPGMHEERPWLLITAIATTLPNSEWSRRADRSVQS